MQKKKLKFKEKNMSVPSNSFRMLAEISSYLQSPNANIDDYFRANNIGKSTQIVIRVFLNCQKIIKMDYESAMAILAVNVAPTDEGWILLREARNFTTVLKDFSNPFPKLTANIIELMKVFTAPYDKTNQFVGARAFDPFPNVPYPNISEPNKLSRPQGNTKKCMSYLHHQLPNSRPASDFGFLFIADKENYCTYGANNTPVIGTEDLYSHVHVQKEGIDVPKQKVTSITPSKEKHLVGSYDKLHEFKLKNPAHRAYTECMVGELVYTDVKALYCMTDNKGVLSCTAKYKILLYREFFKACGFLLPIVELSYMHDIPQMVERFDLEKADFAEFCKAFQDEFNSLSDDTKRIKMAACLIAGCYGSTRFEGTTLMVSNLVPRRPAVFELESKIRRYLQGSIGKTAPGLYAASMDMADQAILAALHAKKKRSIEKIGVVISQDSKIKTASVAQKNLYTINYEFTTKKLFRSKKTLTPEKIVDWINRKLKIKPEKLALSDTKKIEALLTAIEEEDKEYALHAIWFILENYPIDLNTVKAKNGTTLLSIAINKGHFELVALLLNYGAVPDEGEAFAASQYVRDKKEKDPNSEMDPNCEGILYCLVLHSPNINKLDKSHRTLLAYAIDTNNIEIVKFILKRGGNPNFAGTRLPLCRAIFRGYLEIVELLVDHHADVFADDNGETPLSKAVECVNKFKQKQNLEILNIVINRIIATGRIKEADLITHLKRIDLAILYRCLVLACLKDCPKQVELICTIIAEKERRPAPVNPYAPASTVPSILTVNPIDSITSIFTALARKDFVLLDQLIFNRLNKQGSLAEKFQQEGWSYVHLAMIFGRLDILKEFADQDKSILNVLDTRKRTLFYIAAGWGRNCQILDWLYERNHAFLVKARDNGVMPMMAAASDGSVDVLQWFERKDQRLMLTTLQDGWNILHSAVEGQSLAAVQWLCSRPLNLASLGPSQKLGYPLSFAIEQGLVDIAACIARQLVYDSHLRHQAMVFSDFWDAILLNRFDLVRLLCEQNPSSITTVQFNGNNLLHMAILAGNIPFVEWISSQYPQMMNSPTSNGVMPYHLALMNGQLAIAANLPQN